MLVGASSGVGAVRSWVSGEVEVCGDDVVADCEEAGGGEKCLEGWEGSGDWGGKEVSWEVLTVLSGDCMGLLAGGDRCCSSRGLGLGLRPDFISALCSDPDR